MNDGNLQLEPAFARLPALLRLAVAPQRLANGERLFSIGERPRRMFYVLTGEVRLTRSSRSGGEPILQRMRRGFVAEASLEAAAYHCDAAAVGSTIVFGFPLDEFRRLLADDADFRAGWTAHLAAEIRRLRLLCERLSLKGAEARILHYLETEGGGEGIVVVSRKAWAAELGLTHEALYRALARLTARGEVAAEGRSLSLGGPR